MKSRKLKGTGVALITPFDNNMEVDFQALRNIVSHSIECGVEFLVVLGTTAESVTLTKKEKEKIIDTIQEVNQGRLPLVIGIGGNNTKEICEKLSTLENDSFNAILSVSPYYNKPTQEGIYQHFKAVSESTDKNIILYNVPGRTSSNILPETTLRLANDFENIVAIKEASPSLSQAIDTLKDKPENFSVLSGDDELALPVTLAGGDGVISVIGQAIPIYSEMIRLALDKKVDEAYKIQYQILNLIRSIYVEGNPCGVKALLEIQGVCNRATRLPLVKASDKLTEQIEQLYNQVK